MVKMGGLYLERGESIILTTDRVRVNSVEYDMLLTTRQLVLVDVGHTRFQPSMYPLLSILSVKGGKTANGELVISLFFNETGGNSDSGPMVLVFSQQAGEQRKSERDEWIKKLMKLIVSVRQETTDSKSSTTDQKTGIQPSLKRTFAPEMSLPYKTVPDTRPAHIEMIILPDEPDTPAFSEDDEPDVIPGTNAEEEMPNESGQVTGSAATLLLTLLENEESLVESDQFAESPEDLQPTLQDTEESPVVSDHGTGSTGTLQPLLQETEETPVVSGQVAESADVITPPDVLDTIAPTDTLEENTESVITHESSIIDEIPTFAKKDTQYPDLPLAPEQIAIGSPQHSPEEEQELLVETTPQEAAVGESFQQPVADATPPPPKTLPPPSYPGSRRWAFIAVTAIIIIFLVIAGAGVYYSAQLVPPVEEPAPVLTPTVQQTPVPTQIIIPATGVWIRVKYPGNFYGSLGSPGSLRGVNSSGDQLYKMPESAGTLQVNMYKQDTSGNTLSVEIYRNGTIINSRTISVPRGSIEILIDAQTGNPPGLTPTVTPSDNQTGSSSGRIMYF